MSVSSSIDFKLSSGQTNNLSPSYIILMFQKNGWELRVENKIQFLPVGDDDYDWQSQALSDEEFFQILKIKEEKREVIGVDMCWKDSQVGGSFLFWRSGELSIILNSNRKTIVENFTDINWYLCRIIPYFSNAGLLIESVTFSEAILG